MYCISCSADLSEGAEEPAPPAAEPQPEALSPALAALAPLAQVSANPFADSPPAHGAGPIQPIGDVQAWYRALCCSTSGLLYEDPYLQVGLRITATGPSAQVGMFLGNKAGQALERLVCAVPPAPAFTLALGSAPTVIEAGKQIMVPLEVTCLAPFTAPPTLQLGYTLAAEGRTLARTLDLPLPVTRFCQPVDVPASVFTARWAQVAGAPFKLSQPLKSSAPAPEQVAAVLGSLHLLVLDGVDSTPGTVCAACVFHCGAPQARQVPCMVKVEQVEGHVVVTVATADAMTTDSLKRHLVQQLDALV